MFGYAGKILNVDLTTGKQWVEEFDEAFARAYIGGNGFGAKIVFDRVKSGTDPFAPENVLVFAVGPITDTLVTSNSRGCLSTKSPLTGLFFDSTYGGGFPITQKKTGFDVLVVTGAAAAPSYLLVTEQGAQVLPAGDLWGRLETLETNKTLQARHGADADVIAIGCAGEHQVRFAGLSHYWKSREGISGRGGHGAVMGSKRLKAIVVKGSRKTEVADPKGLKAFVDSTREDTKKGTVMLNKYGTPVLVHGINKLGGLGSFNNRTEVFAEAEAICGERYHEVYFEKDTTCNKCPVACGKQFVVKAGEFEGLRWKMPEYETIYAFGSMTGNSDAASIIKAEELCDQYALDTISMGVTIAFAMECFERGLLKTADTGGMDLRWGDHRTILRLVEMTARREGFGDLLAEGSRRLAEKLGPEASKYLYAVKGLEMPAHSARALKGMSIGYATASRGGSHHDTRPTPQYAGDFDKRSPEGKPAFAIRSQHFTAVDDSLVQCRFTSERGGYGLYLNDKYAAMVNHITGWGVDADELERAGERICNLERAVNVREGVRRKDDDLPWRVKNEPIPEGASQGCYCPQPQLDAMLDEYYALRGWSKDGVPTAERLKALGLDFAI
jgi:aldehyde:ferredoxin oxidoreductase